MGEQEKAICWKKGEVWYHEVVRCNTRTPKLASSSRPRVCKPLGRAPLVSIEPHGTFDRWLMTTQ